MPKVEDTPALNLDEMLKDTSEMVWQYSESEEVPIPNGALAPPSDDDKSDDGLIAPGKVSSTVPPHHPQDLPDLTLIVDGLHYQKPSMCTIEGKEKPGVGLHCEINDFFHPKVGRCIDLVYLMLL